MNGPMNIVWNDLGGEYESRTKVQRYTVYNTITTLYNHCIYCYHRQTFDNALYVYRMYTCR